MTFINVYPDLIYIYIYINYNEINRQSNLKSMFSIFIILKWAEFGTGEVDTGFWWGNLKEKDNLETLRLGGGIILK